MKAKLLDDSSSEDDFDESGGVALQEQSLEDHGFKINEAYARRFEHNKKREELHRLEEKYGKSSIPSKRKALDEDDEDDEHSDDPSSTSEEEDEEAFLATADLDAEMSNVLNALKSKDPSIYDPKCKFYSEITENDNAEATEHKGKPMYLRDYHRKNLLEGHVGAEEQEETTSKSYAQEQDDLKKSIVKEMHAAANNHEDAASESGESDDDGGFLIPKVRPAKKTLKETSEAPKPVVDPSMADKDPELFLSNFMTARAWVPTENSRFQPFESDDEDEDERADAFEQAYNFRFEDPEGSNEKLRSHARDAAAKHSVRREAPSRRQKAREAQREKKTEEMSRRNEEMSRLRRLKVDDVEAKVRKIKEAAGLRGKSIELKDWSKFLEGDWDDNKWEEEMNARFGEDYYAAEDFDASDDDNENVRKKKRVKKPKWHDEIDIDDLVPDFDDANRGKPSFTLSDSENEGTESDIEMIDGPGVMSSKTSRSKKDRLKERASQKRAARLERKEIEEFVDEKFDFNNMLPDSKQARFHYRETSPMSLGLTPRDILLASDAQLNQFAGLKKLATFRDPEKKRKDKKRLGKKARLRQWRKETFGNEEGPAMELNEVIPTAKNAEVVKDGPDIREGKKKRKRSRKNKRLEAI